MRATIHLHNGRHLTTESLGCVDDVNGFLVCTDLYGNKVLAVDIGSISYIQYLYDDEEEEEEVGQVH